jgi:hypothetical protein
MGSPGHNVRYCRREARHPLHGLQSRDTIVGVMHENGALMR